MEEQDFIKRQIKSFAQGIGSIINVGHANNGVEIMLPAEQGQNLPFQDTLLRYLNMKHYKEGFIHLLKLESKMSQFDFNQLGIWYVYELNKIPSQLLIKDGLTENDISTLIHRLNQTPSDNKEMGK
ncbi:MULTISPECIES: hypothetical protein [Latilactobacillus]|uniref:Uncharacterized protein lasV n=1 Tax=Latilactobacillus sakei TaxID=1599 RepID=Q48853_LATSK|nr:MULTISPECIES: hypothetical protein [Latilactobacillus]ASN13548.1 hypothetical protein B4V05_09945 [Latilactobacillus sakei]MCM1636296.1 hypothetical protein [Latilactobacillus sakei]MCW8780650.1 hypothetical protein [Latilactobacillus curvatus]USF99102.1 hypothetical protein A4W81_09680 [Latilactobacillus sakei]UTB73248.1 hypothetical protein A4W72_10845 [Latilactobacillus curvatus]